MKKYIIILSVSFLFSTDRAKAQTSNDKNNKGSSISVLNGVWQTSLRASATNTSRIEFRVMHDGFMSVVGQDSTGAWRETVFATYEISGNVIKTRIKYSSHPDRMGLTHWLDYKINGDTLNLVFFKKLIGPNGEDRTSQMQRVEQKYVRAKKSSM